MFPPNTCKNIPKKVVIAAIEAWTTYRINVSYSIVTQFYSLDILFHYSIVKRSTILSGYIHITVCRQKKNCISTIVATERRSR